MAKKYLEYEQGGVKYNLYDMPDGFVIRGEFDISHQELEELPDLSGVVVDGNFDCSYNKLTSLKGAPQKVSGEFRCHDNALTSLEGAPEKVGGFFNCDNNRLTTLRGAPKVAGEGFSCSDNQLTSLEGAPEKIGKDEYFWCDGNNLESLLSLPKYDDGNLIFCDKKLGEKYGISDAEDSGFVYEQLVNSPRYKAELLKREIAQKKEKEFAAERQKAGAWYESFKKNSKSESRE